MSIYLAGHSYLHRCPPGIKLLLMLGISPLIFSLHNSWMLWVTLLAILSLYYFVGFSWRIMAAQIYPTRWLLVILFISHIAWVGSWASGTQVVLRLILFMLMASLLTLSTRLSDMMDTLKHSLRPFTRIGLNPANISLCFALALRLIPLVMQILREVREAQQVRGLERRFIALIIPTMVRTFKMAEDMHNAFEARSV